MWYPVLEIYVLYYFLLANSFLDIKDLEFKKLGIQAGLVLVTSMELFLLFLWFKHVELIYWHPARRSAMTGVKGQKILILQQQRPTFSCTCLRYWFGCSPLKRISFNHLLMICKIIFPMKCRNLRLRANHALVLLAESRDDPAVWYCSIM